MFKTARDQPTGSFLFQMSRSTTDAADSTRPSGFFDRKGSKIEGLGGSTLDSL